MDYLEQQTSVKKFFKLILIISLALLPFFWTLQSLVQFSYQPKNTVFFLKLISGFAIIFLFPRFYWIKIPALIFFLVPVYSFLAIGSDQLKAIEYFVVPKYSSQELIVQIFLNTTCIALFFLMNHFEKKKWGKSLILLGAGKSKAGIAGLRFKYKDLFLGKYLILSFALNLFGIYFFIVLWASQSGIIEPNFLKVTLYPLVYGFLCSIVGLSLSFGFRTLAKTGDKVLAYLYKSGSALFLLLSICLFLFGVINRAQ